MNIYEVSLSEVEDADNVWLTATGVAKSAMSAGRLVLTTELAAHPEFSLEVRSILLLAECEFIEK